MTEVISALFVPILFIFIMCLVASSVGYALLVMLKIVWQGVQWVRSVM
jgi:hypothetical protein